MVISQLTKKKMNVNIKNINPEMCTLSSGADSYDLSLVKPLRGGKSGDKVLLVRDLDTVYVLKVFTPGDQEKSEKDDKEIEYHIRFMNLFSKYVPCPKIYMYGVLDKVPFVESVESISCKYVIMEALTPPYELDTLILNRCSRISDPYTDSIDLDNVVMQLFYLLTKMKTRKLFHCDMHPQNIMIVKNTEPVTLNFNHIGSDYQFKLGDHLVKIIDFGEGARSSVKKGKIKSCRLVRTTSGALEDLKSKCTKSSKLFSYTKLITERVLGTSGDMDINFFINILKVLTTFDSKYNLDFESLESFSESMHRDFSSNNSMTIVKLKHSRRYIVMLKKFLDILIQNIGKKRNSRNNRSSKKNNFNRNIRKSKRGSRRSRSSSI